MHTPAATPSATPAPPEQEEVRVVIVEDDDDVRQALALLVEADGYLVDTVANGSQALGVVEAFQPHVVLVDLNLPGLDGAEVTRQLRERVGSWLVIIAVTAIALPSERDRLEAAGVDFILTKPVGVEELRRFLPPLAHAAR